MNFQEWKADIERRARKVKELPQTFDLDSLVQQLVMLMEKTEEMVDYYAGAEQFDGAYYILDGQIACVRQTMSSLDPASKDFDISTTTYPESFANLLLDVHRVTLDRLKELRQEVDAEVAARTPTA